MNTPTLILNVTLMALLCVVVATAMCLPLFLDRGTRGSRAAGLRTIDRTRIAEPRRTRTAAGAHTAGANPRI
jgi:hypothetical protein